MMQKQEKAFTLADTAFEIKQFYKQLNMVAEIDIHALKI